MQSAYRCTKIRKGIHTKQIGNRLNNLVLNKNRYLNLWKPYQKEIVKKESHFSKSKPRRSYNILELYTNKTMTLESQKDQNMERNWNLQNTTNFPNNVTHLLSGG
jgi:hypothetical protein